MPTFHTTRRVEFRDTDAAGIMHFSTFFTYMEEAEHDFWRSLGLSVMMRDEEGEFSWPRISAACDFRRAVKFEDELHIEIRIARLGTKSVTFEAVFRVAEETVAEGRMSVVCCRVGRDVTPVSIPIPDHVAEKLRPHVAV